MNLQMPNVQQWILWIWLQKGLGGSRGPLGTPGDPWGPPKHQISLNFRVFPGFPEIPLFSLWLPIFP